MKTVKELVKELQKEFETYSGLPVTNEQGEPDIDYVYYLEQRVIELKNQNNNLLNNINYVIKELRSHQAVYTRIEINKVLLLLGAILAAHNTLIQMKE